MPRGPSLYTDPTCLVYFLFYLTIAMGATPTASVVFGEFVDALLHAMLGCGAPSFAQDFPKSGKIPTAEAIDLRRRARMRSPPHPPGILTRDEIGVQKTLRRCGRYIRRAYGGWWPERRSRRSATHLNRQKR